jgi:hypothetical protein
MRAGERVRAPLMGKDLIKCAFANAGAAESSRNTRHDRNFMRGQIRKGYPF